MSETTQTSPLLKPKDDTLPQSVPTSAFYDEAYPAQPPYYEDPYYQHSLRPRRSPARRLFRAFVFVSATLVLFKMAFHVIPHSWTHGFCRGGHARLPYEASGLPIPHYVKVHDCIEGESWSDNPSITESGARSSYTSFELPVSSDLLLFLARGSTSHGSISVLSSAEVGDSAKVDVTVEYYRSAVRDEAKVCLIKLEEGENGVGIFTPIRNHRHRWRSEDRLSFKVVVTLPASADGSPLPIRHLQTDLPIFAHTLGDLKKSVDFRFLSLQTSNMPIIAQSIYAHHAKLQTSNGPIRGSFKTSTSLSLVTSNGPIIAKVDLVNDEEYDVTNLILKTSNAPINTNITLTSTKSTGGKFNVDSKSSNNAMNLRFPNTAVDSTLTLDAATSNAPAYVTLDRAYEGTFSLHSSMIAPHLERSQVDDPSGRGRQRSIEYHSIGRGLAEGSIRWTGEGKHGEGSVKVRTSNSPAVLKV